MTDIRHVSDLDDDDDVQELICVSQSSSPVSGKKRRRLDTDDEKADVLCLTSDAALAAAAANAHALIFAVSDDALCIASDAQVAIAAASAQELLVSAAIEEDAEVFCVASDEALAMAIKNLPDVSGINEISADAAIAAVAAEAEADEAGLVAETFECACCFEEVPPLEGVRMSPMRCDHMMCLGCFKRYASAQIENKDLCRCPLCPAATAHLVPGWLIQRTLGKEAGDANSSNEQIHLNQVDGGKLSWWQCPTPDCRNRQLLPEDWEPSRVPDSERVVDCAGCGKRICLRCNVEEHAGYSCEQFEEWRRANASADTSYAALLQSGLIKPCPNCAAPILKTEGCNFMTCTSCKSPNGMCWETGKARWGPNGCGGGHQCH